MCLYRKKSITVSAFQWTGEITEITPTWFCNLVYNHKIIINETGQACINTVNGIQPVVQGDFIISGIKGELYSVKPDIFYATYEKL